MIFDEIHLAKSMGLLQTVCHQLARHVDFKIGQSATPLINSPLDLCFVTNASNFPQGNGDANVDIPTTAPEERTIPNFFKEARLHLGRQRRLDRTSMSHIIPILYNAVEEDDPGRSNRPPLFLSSALDKRQTFAAAREVIPHGIQLEGDYRRAAQYVFDLMGQYIVRRGKQAVDSQGQKMLPLGKLTQTTINVQLRDDEIEDVNEYLHRVCEARKEKLGDNRGFE
jgi:hypothetical protein